VLVYQFVSGLPPKLKQKVALLEGKFEQQLSRARFDEVKKLNVTGSGVGDKSKKPYTRGYKRTAHSQNGIHSHRYCQSEIFSVWNDRALQG